MPFIKETITDTQSFLIGSQLVGIESFSSPRLVSLTTLESSVCPIVKKGRRDGFMPFQKHLHEVKQIHSGF